ncbi:serine/threonine protein kinase [Nocardia cyriacigeorgica]|uniref:serine/threonine-protein kinase n=1 Tax=Nocardia cyriacigeorgica TaxID=135487 RepID=UPI001895D44D|nr:serine/threonine-protein kinase [Nocardia cyriacigeorgica]MBF6323883.1 serine/threonine protein kinase [Nocardia cyriacigeorgica]
MSEREIRAGALVDFRFRLELPIGKGGVAEVWRAHDAESDRTVAVKFLRPSEEIADSVDTRWRDDELQVVYARFEREAKLLGAMNHRAIPALVHHGNHRGTPYLVMQFIDGVSLREYLDRWRPLPRGYAVVIAVEVAGALQAAHQKPVVHRDLKPQNIVIGEDGRVFLLDFGIALPLTSGTTRYTMQGGTLGSPGYQAPEQIREDPVEPRTDTYPLGCILFEMITGRTPFLTGDRRGLAGQHLDCAPPSLAEYVPHVPPAIDDLVNRMLAKQPFERPDMAEIVEVLTPFLPAPGSAPVPAPRPTPDPTQWYRSPSGEGAPPGPAPAPRPRVSSTWLKRSEVRKLCVAAERELVTGSPGTSLAALAESADAIRKEWGPRREEARRARFLAAEGLRIQGECGRAEDLYRQIADDLEGGTTVDDQVTVAICRLRAAECGLAFGNSEPALTTLGELDSTIAALSPESAGEVRAVWAELVTYLRELKYVEQVEDVLRHLGDH